MLVSHDICLLVRIRQLSQFAQGRNRVSKPSLSMSVMLSPSQLHCWLSLREHIALALFGLTSIVSNAEAVKLPTHEHVQKCF